MAGNFLYEQVTRVRTFLRDRTFLRGSDEGRTLEYFTSVVVFIDTLSCGMVIPILPSFALRFHSSQALTTSLLALRGATAVFSAFPAGFVVSYFGHRNVLLFSLLGTVVASLCLAFPLYFPFLVVSLFLQGLCSELAWSTGLSLGAHLYGKKSGMGEDEGVEERERKGGLEEPLLGDSHSGVRKESDGGEGGNGLVGAVGVLFGMSSLGFLLGPFLGAVIYEYTTTWMPFLIVTILTLVVIFALLLLTSGNNLFSGQNVSTKKEEKTNHEGESSLQIRPLVEPEQETESGTGMEAEKAKGKVTETEKENESEGELLKEAILDATKNSTILTMISVTIITIIQNGAIEVLLPFFLVDTCSHNTAEVGFIFGVISITYGISTSQAGKFVDRFGSTSCIIFGLVLQSIASPILFLGRSTCSLLLESIFMAIVGISLAFSSTPCFPEMVKVFGEMGFKSYTVVVGLYNTAYTIGGAFGPLLAAGLINYLPPSILIGICSIFILICVPFVWLGRPSRAITTQLC